MISLALLGGVWYTLQVLGGVAAQDYQIAPCNRSNSEIAWTYNEQGESPCYQWWNLGMACYGGWSLGPLASNNTNYHEPPSQDACECGTLAYNLMAACTWCEADNFDSNWVSEKQWSTNCQSFNNHGIDASTGDRLFSKWAFATNYGGIWSPERSRQIALTGRILGPPKTELAAGAVAGIVITILVILTLVGAGVYLFRRRQRAKQQDGEVTPDQFMAVLYDSHGAHSLPRTPGSKSMSDQANVPVSRTLGSPNAPAATAAVAAVDADSIALAILRRVGHEPPGYTPAGSHESVISAYPPPSQVSNPFSHDTMSTSDFGSVSTPSVSSADHRREKRQTIPPPPIEKD